MPYKETTDVQLNEDFSTKFECPGCGHGVWATKLELAEPFDVECQNCGIPLRCNFKLMIRWDDWASVWKL